MPHPRERCVDLTARERPDDYGFSPRGVLYHGCSCCCCLWTLTGLAGAAVGGFVGHRRACLRFGPMPPHVSTGFVLGLILAALLAAGGALAYGETGALGPDPALVIFLVFGAALVVPAGLGGLAGAAIARHQTRTDPKGYGKAKAGAFRSALYTFVGMLIGGVLGTLPGLLILRAL